MLEAELRRVDADDLQAEWAVFGVPALQIDHGTAAVDAGIGPEVDQDDLAAQSVECERRGGVDPPAGFLERRCGVPGSRYSGDRRERPGGRRRGQQQSRIQQGSTLHRTLPQGPEDLAGSRYRGSG